MMQPDRSCRCGCSVPWPKPEPPRPPCSSCPPCPPRECHCHDCCCAPQSCAQRPSHAFLLPRVLAAGRQWQRRCSLCLELCGLPDCIEGPLTLICVSACGESTWEAVPVDSPHVLCLRVTIPLHCQVRDRCGAIHAARASITTEVTLRLSCPAAECWRHQMLLLPCVRLACPPCPSECSRFDVQLELLVEAYLIRWEPCSTGVSQPACPQLPLYPQPCFD